jgi:hypothetical protein
MYTEFHTNFSSGNLVTAIKQTTKYRFERFNKAVVMLGSYTYSEHFSKAVIPFDFCTQWERLNKAMVLFHSCAYREAGENCLTRSVMICTQDYQVEENEMGGACGANRGGGRETCIGYW